MSWACPKILSTPIECHVIWGRGPWDLAQCRQRQLIMNVLRAGLHFEYALRNRQVIVCIILSECSVLLVIVLRSCCYLCRCVLTAMHI